jgi:hypothetical protein
VPLDSSHILGMIDGAVALRGSDTHPISVMRRSFLIDLRARIESLGFPLPADRKLDACIMPFIFQELNYGDYDWSSPTAPLGPQEDLVDIDVAIWSDGRRRSELTEAEYGSYHKFCLNAISHRSRR